MYFNMKGVAVFLLAAVLCQAAPTNSASGTNAAPEAAPNQYVVRMTPGMGKSAFDTTMGLVRTALGQDHLLRHTFFFSDFRGFSMEASPTVVETIRAIPGIIDIEPNWVGHQNILQKYSTYGLDRISHHQPASVAGRDPYTFEYFRPAGAQTTIYVIDSGVYINHNDFTGRARHGANYAPANVFNNPNDFTDYSGHGTHVASIAAGYNYGVAKFANIVDVKIFNDNGTTYAENGVAGISYAANEAENAGQVATSVLQMSFGYPDHPHNNIIGYAVRSAINAGLFCVVAAGNAKQDAQYSTPANVQQACTIGATDSVDHMAAFSNYGQLIDLWAPGVDIPAAGIGGPAEIVNKSGTSMAAPYVSGVGAYLKSFGTQYTGYQPQALCSLLADKGNRGFITFQPYATPPGPNALLYDLGGTV